MLSTELAALMICGLFLVSVASVKTVLSKKYLGYSWTQSLPSNALGSTANAYTIAPSVVGFNNYWLWSGIQLSYIPNYWVQTGYVFGPWSLWALKYFAEKQDANGYLRYVDSSGPSYGQIHLYTVYDVSANAIWYCYRDNVYVDNFVTSNTYAVGFEENGESDDAWPGVYNFNGTHFWGIYYSNTTTFGNWQTWYYYYSDTDTPPYHINSISPYEFTGWGP